ncbi:unnamed protein product [Caenorhabditis brenneri]
MALRNLTQMWIYGQSFVYSEDDFWAGFLVSTECFVGFFMLFSVIIGCYRIPILRNNAFGILMVNQNVSQLVACANSGLFFFFGVLLNIKAVQEKSNYSGNLSVFLLVLILGGISKTKNLIIFNWMFSLIMCIWIFGFRECNFIFYNFGWVMTGAPYTEICRDLVLSYNMFVQILLSALIFGLDIVTLFIIVILRNRLYAKQSTSFRRREISFGMQVLIQGLVFLAHGIWYDMGYSWVPGNDERWKTFFTTSFSANLMHIFDPLVVFIFNPGFRKWIADFWCSGFSKRQSTVASAIATSTFRNDSYFTEADENYIFGPEDTKVGIIISSVTFTGVLIQAAVVTGAHSIKNIKGSIFGALILNETFGQFAATVTSFSFFFFGLALNSLFIVSHSAFFGNISLTMLPIILGSHTLMAFNRFCASSMPFKYKKVFSQKTVIIYIIINWTVPPIIFCWFFFFYKCYFPFFQLGWVFMEALRNETCGPKLLLLSLSFQFLLVFAISIFDIITFVILVTCRRKMFKTQSKEIRKREINFAMQVLVQGGVMMFVGFWYVNGYSILPGRELSWKIFYTTTLSSCSVNCLAPIVICFFNAEYRRWILSMIRKRKSGHSVTVVTSRASK